MHGQNLRGPFSGFFKGDGKTVCGVLIWLYGASPHQSKREKLLDARKARMRMSRVICAVERPQGGTKQTK